MTDAAQAAAQTKPAGAWQEPRARLRAARLCLWCVVAITSAATLSAAARTSLTFDEITLMSGGARGLTSGRYDLIPDHPPLIQYIYGMAALLAGATPPADSGETGTARYRWDYSRRMVFSAGTDPEKVALAARAFSCGCALALVLLVFSYTRRRFGPGPGLLAAVLTATLPDLLAHGGVAYNDVPLALLCFASGWAAERFSRAPGGATGLLVGLLVAITSGIKYSGILLLPIIGLNLAAEARNRVHDAPWRRATVRGLVAALGSAYVVSVLIYRGDLLLHGLSEGLLQQVDRVWKGHEAATAYLHGATSQTGWWYFFPAVFLLKTPAAFHALLAAAAAGLLVAIPGHPRWAAVPRAALSSLIVYLPVLLLSRLAIGFRHALPLLPWLCVLAAAGCSRFWTRAGFPARAATLLLALWHAGSALSWYPHFLAYTSEYVASRDRGRELLLDSNLDWGQGLLEVRRYMRRHGIDRVFLSYFGSALPAAYGVDYVPLPSFLDLPAPETAPGPAPEYAVISATHLHGLFVDGDPFASLRRERPVAVLGHTMFVYRVSANRNTGLISVVPEPEPR